jgi:23S rRNA pseudouridine1911/1915/1917 synthase
VSESEQLVVEPHETGLRLDLLLVRRLGLHSRSYIQRLISEGLVLIDGAPEKKGIKVKGGEEIEVQFALTPEISLQPEPIPLDIIYEDEWLLAINKPAGLVVHPAVGNWSGTFVNALLHHCSHLPNTGSSLRPGIVHRLDKETSGVLLAAKTEVAHQRLVSLFADRQIEKEYLAICCGKPSVCRIEAPIGRDPRDRKRQAISGEGKSAVTEFELLQANSELSVVVARPRTGRTHQIRVHLRHAGSPVLGDPLYGWPHWNTRYRVERQLLHAYRLVVPHPITGGRLSLEAAVPQEMQRMREKIGCAH